MGVEDEFLLLDKNDSWPTVYRQIRTEAEARHDLSVKDALRPEFRSRNRYRDVNPYDHSRVHIESRNIDYINASLVLSLTVNRSYILTQGPLAETAGHFWLMVWEQSSKAILMLNKLIEKGQVKCFPYYPAGAEHGGQDEMMFEDVGLKVTFLSNLECNNQYTARLLRIEELETSKTKDVTQFHYTAWPDFGVPESPSAFLDFLFAVRASGGLDASVGPAVIHCSAGIGRSGTFCLVDTCLLMIERDGDVNDDVNVRDVLLDMRTYRMGLIQTADQLRFSYLAIVEGIKCVLPNNRTAAVGGTEATEKLRNNEHNKNVNKKNINETLRDAPDGLLIDTRDGTADPGAQQSFGAEDAPDKPLRGSPPRLERSVPHACDTEEASRRLWKSNNPSFCADEPMILPGCASKIQRLRRRSTTERVKSSESDRTLMRKRQAEYGLTARPLGVRASRAWGGTRTQIIGLTAMSAAIAGYYLYRVFYT